jgi:two-component system sensor histidine kinase RpfC
MKAYLKKLRGDLSPEQEILRNRLVMGGTSGIGCYLFAFDAIIFSAFFAYLSCNAVLYAMQKRDIRRPEERWFAAIILDVMMAFTVMLREPEHMSIFYPIILWMILGNGFRYGVKWLFIAAILSTITFGFVVVSTTYWQQNSFLGYALTLALLVIPAYCSTLIRKISHAKEQAEMASKAKSYFLASVSHELRTPLNAIIGYGNHLRNSDMPRPQKEMIEASVLAGEHLLHLIEQLIEVAKTGTGSAQVKTSTFRPTELLTEIRNIMAVRIDDKGLALHLQAEPLSDRLVEGPTDVLRNILLNLVGNALKFTEAGNIAIHSGFSSEAGKDHIWFSVSDTGIGIAENAIERIFQPFQQADETVLNRFGGTGLGLAICKQLVEQVNGRISAKSNLGRGSTFLIEVPVNLVPIEENEWVSGTSDIVHIISFGNIAPELLVEARTADNFILRHINCATPDELATIIADKGLRNYKVALISHDLARQIEPDNAIWEYFADAEIAPVLVSDDQEVDLEEVALRAAFASILPAAPNFAELRSAIRIGCSFARQFKPAEENANPAKPIYHPRRILVADDNRTNRNVLGAILGSANHDVTMVTDGDEALDALENGQFDILLLDINMPRLNGIDACMMWRQIEGGRQHLPIVGVTADATADTEIRCKKAGMDMRITKPVDAKLLLATIENLCAPTAQGLAAIENAGPDPLNVVIPLSTGTSLEYYSIDPSQIEYLRSIGDEVFVSGMIDGFFEDTEQTLEPLRLSVHNGKVHDFRFCAHAIKSSSNNMGAKKLAELCGKLERVTEAEFDENRFQYLEKIERELNKVLNALKAISEDQIYDKMSGSVR